MGMIRLNIYENIIKNISNYTTIDADIISLILKSFIVLIIFSILRRIGNFFIKRKLTGHEEFFFNKGYQVFLNVIEILVLLIIWSQLIKDLMTLISVVSAAMTFALREIILNFFCGIYIKVRKPFQVEDRILVDGIKGDVMNIKTLDFEIIEVSTEIDNGQSTGVIVTFPNSFVLKKAVKNINKGFKYIWNELKIKVTIDSDLVKNKQEIYKIVNGLETIKNIPKKMKSQIMEINNTNRVYFNKYEPIIYTKIVDKYVELSVRYLMHPKKARYVESVIWNKIYLAYKDKKIDLYIGD